MRQIKKLKEPLLKEKVCLNSQKGEALISAVIGAFLIMAVVGIALSSTHNMLEGEVLPSKSPALCREVASEVVNLIRSNGTQARAFKTPVNGDRHLLNSERWHRGREEYNSSGVSTEYGIGGGYINSRWPEAPVINWSGSGNYRAHTPRLIQSSLNALLSIYNATPASCRNDQGINLTKHRVLSALAPRKDIDNHSIDVSMRINPYNVKTGQLTSCERNLWLRPYALSEPPRAEQDNILDLSRYTPDRGLEVEVFVDVTPKKSKRRVANRDNNNEETEDTFKCSLKNRFQYDMSYTRPLAPVAMFNDSGRLLIDLNEDNRAAPGTHMVCRDNFVRYNFGGPGSWITPPAIVAQKQYPGPEDGWGPCNQLTVCGRSANDVQTNDRQTRMTLEYSVPDDCMVNVEVRNVDVVGNVSAVSSTGIYNDVPDGGGYDDGGGGGGGGSPGGYEVNGTEYTSMDAAQTAADLVGAGATINEVQNVSAAAYGNTTAMRNVSRSSSNALSDQQTASASATSAQSAASAAQGAAAGATSSSTSASSARSSATSARSSATSARSSATASRSAATSARSNANSARATANANPTPANEKAAQEAEASASAAEEAAEAAEEAARAAEAAARAAEQAAREKEEAEENDDDDNDDGP